MRTVEVGASFSLTTSSPTPTFLRVRPSIVHSPVGEISVTDQDGDDLDGISELDWFGGDAVDGQRVDRFLVPTGRNSVSFFGEVDVDDLPDPMPNDLPAPCANTLRPEHWWWLQASRYCRPDELGVEAWIRFGRHITPEKPATGLTVRNICSFVNEEMTFEMGSTTTSTNATQAWTQRRGVCRDYNHIAASFCRALNIPTRYVFGYLPDLDGAQNDLPMDFCAWIEVCLEDSWWTFDARVNEPRVGRIVVGRGRDAADVPFVSTLGAAELSDLVVRACDPTDIANRAIEMSHQC
jgi:transglutaminase-like putative cysteine protease